jgi:hypothetical protein
VVWGKRRGAWVVGTIMKRWRESKKESRICFGHKAHSFVSFLSFFGVTLFNSTRAANESNTNELTCV